jgi:ankyrin repeat protein
MIGVLLSRNMNANMTDNVCLLFQLNFIEYSQEGLTALHVAAMEGHEVIITELVEESDASIYCVTEEGSTPLHLAALNGHTECVLRLIHYGAHIDALDTVLLLLSPKPTRSLQ